ncbi:hypothetical protein [Sphingobium sp. CFD-2]|uniref:hypothetical protein n=1 Tax=Sphingobium sp. CFD-2 TaxID=2878542 RepID=UPI00214C160E|nr:hypothetical protein [Sphingobium sp. CFD-2]
MTTKITHDADCGSFRLAHPGPCDCSASAPRIVIPKLTPAQRRLLASLQPVAMNGRCYRYPVSNRPGRGLVSAWALWRRGYVATNEFGGPDASERRDRGIVVLTPLGEQLLAAFRKAS